MKSCPSSNNYDKFICQYDVQDEADELSSDAWTLVGKYKCMYEIKTLVVLNRCIPDTNVDDAAQSYANTTGSSLSADAVYSTAGDSEWYVTFVGSLWDLRGYIFGFGLGVSVAVSFAYLYLLRLPGLLFGVIWGAIGTIAVCLFVGSWMLWALAIDWEDNGSSDTEVITMKVFSYIGIAATIIYVCIILVLRKRIMLAIGIIKQASRAMTSMPLIVLLPVVQATLITMFIIVWMIYVLYLASSGETKVTSYETGDDITVSYKTFEYTDNTRFAFLYLLFCWFWTSEFVLAVGQLVIALAFSCWYFTRVHPVLGSNGNLIWSAKAVMRYHLGTAAYGSLIIAIIKTIRAVVAYIQKKAKKSGNKIAEYIMCAIGCCLWCIEKCMKFLNKHAYILTAIYGYGFCKSARRAFFLLLRNILRVAAVNMVASFVLIIGKLVTPTLTTFLCYLCVGYGADLEGSSGIVVPMLFVFVLSYWIAGMFAELFGMGIETILFCYIADEEMFSVENRFADKDLKSALQKTAEKKKELDEAKQRQEQVKVHPNEEGGPKADKEMAVEPYSSPPHTPVLDSTEPPGDATF